MMSGVDELFDGQRRVRPDRRVNLRTEKDVIDELERLYRDGLSGTVPASEVAQLSAVLSRMLAALNQGREEDPELSPRQRKLAGAAALKALDEKFPDVAIGNNGKPDPEDEDEDGETDDDIFDVLDRTAFSEPEE